MQHTDQRRWKIFAGHTLWLQAASVALLIAGCPAKSTLHDAGDTSDAGPGCVGDPRADTYSANLQQTGTAGVFHFTLVKSDPAPPAKGNNTWQVQLSDLAGNAVSGATLTAKTFMPDHGHGSSVVAQVTATANGYQVTPLYLFMSGLWQITLSAKSGSQSDSAVFAFCIPR